MRIGIVTFHCAYNYGSVIQAYALKEYLKQHGHDAHVIDYRSRNFDQYKLLRTYNAKVLLSDVVFFRRNLKRKRNFEEFQRRYLDLTANRYEEPGAEAALRRDAGDFDAVICGSDQIWNLDCTCGPVGPFFLDFAAPGCRRIAYAPSLNRMEFEPKYFDAAAQQRIGHLLDQFDAISVREANTAPVFQKLTAKPFSVVVDPTLLHADMDIYRKIESPSLPKGVEQGKFLFAYTLWQNKEMKQYTEDLARRKNLTIVYSAKIPIKYDVPSINCFGMSPSLFLTLIDKAEYVISNSFHATVFSILFEKRFITFGVKKSNSRMSDLLSKLGMEDHLVSEHYHESVDPQGADYPRVKEILADMRAGSERFLDAALA